MITEFFHSPLNFASEARIPHSPHPGSRWGPQRPAPLVLLEDPGAWYPPLPTLPPLGNSASRGAVLPPCVAVAGSCLLPSSGAPGPPAEVTWPGAGPGWSGAAAGEGRRVPRKLKLGRDVWMRQGAGVAEPLEGGAGACQGPVCVSWTRVWVQSLPRGRVWWEGAQGDCTHWTGAAKAQRSGPACRTCVGCGGPPPAQLLPAPLVVPGRVRLGPECPRQLEKWRSRRLRTPGLPVPTGTQPQLPSLDSGLRSLVHHLP